MPSIDFYILQDAHPKARFITACRLADKGYQSGKPVYIHCDSQAQAQMMDELLWTFRDGGFVPHTTHPAPEGDRSPVLIGNGPTPPGNTPIMINVATNVPDFIDRFERILEIIDGDPERRQQGRERYRHYRSQGMELTDHKL